MGVVKEEKILVNTVIRNEEGYTVKSDYVSKLFTNADAFINPIMNLLLSEFSMVLKENKGMELQERKEFSACLIDDNTVVINFEGYDSQGTYLNETIHTQKFLREFKGLLSDLSKIKDLEVYPPKYDIGDVVMYYTTNERKIGKITVIEKKQNNFYYSIKGFDELLSEEKLKPFC